MSEFVWQAAQASGAIIEGQISADSLPAAMQQLRARGLTPLRLDVLTEPSQANLSAGAGAPIWMQRKQKVDNSPVSRTDILAITSELSIMLRAGLALGNALRVLIDMSHKPSMSNLLQQILKDVKGGTPLSKALQRERALFGDFYINMIRSGEASGQISDVMARLVEHMERLRALRDSVISATIYPMILLAISVLSVIGMLGFVVPQFEKLFSDLGDALPLPTKIVMIAGQGFSRYGLVIGIALVFGVWLIGRWLRSPAGRHWWQSSALRLPMIGRLVLKYQLTLFARSLGTLLGNGVPMLTALGIATETVGNLILRQALLPVAPMVKEGEKVVNAMAATQIFEPLGINLIRVGEETGRIGPMMLELASVLDREVEVGIKRSLTLIEPILILVLGVLIAMIIISILMGILAINNLAV